MDVFHETVKRTGVAYDGRTGGLLYLYRSEAALKAASAKSRILSDNGCRIETLDRDGVARARPGAGAGEGEASPARFMRRMTRAAIAACSRATWGTG